MKSSEPAPNRLAKYIRNRSLSQLLVFILVFAAIGGYFIWRSAATTQTVASVEAEQMALPAGATVYSDASASSGKAVQFASNGSATSSFTVPTGASASSLTITAHGNKCRGWASMTATVDNTTVLSTTSISSAGWSNYGVTVNLVSGSHTLKLIASNVGSKDNCSRDLYVDVSTLFGSITTPAPTIAFSASPTSISAGGSSTLTWTTTNAASCNASGAWSGSEPTSGSTSTGAINTTSTYGLACTGNGGTASASATVSVTSPTDTGTLLFAGYKVADFPTIQAVPGDVTDVPDPAGSGTSVIKMTVKDTDGSYFADGKPRAQVLSPYFFTPGMEYWWHSKFYLPSTGFPASPSSWINVMQGPFGSPYSGSPPWSIKADSGPDLRWQRNATYGWDVPWSRPIVRDHWYDVLVHGRFGTDGWIEMWIDGQQVTFFSGNTVTSNPNKISPTTRLYMQTMDSSNNGGSNAVYLQDYRAAGWIDTVTVYQGPMLIGTSRTAVGG